MDLEAIRQPLWLYAQVLVVEERLIRRVIKRDRDLQDFIHKSCYVLPKDRFLDIVPLEDIGFPIPEHLLPEDVILVTLPHSREWKGRSLEEILLKLWQAVFHARIHAAFEKQLEHWHASELRKRIEAIGRSEFNEAVAILQHDEWLLAPHDLREVYIEFAAVFLELYYFAPDLLATTFPGLSKHTRIHRVLTKDLDVDLLLRGRIPPQIVLPTPRISMGKLEVTKKIELKPLPILTARKSRRLYAKAKRAFQRKNDALAALFSTWGMRVEDQGLQTLHRVLARKATQRLIQRMREVIPLSKWKVLDGLVQRAVRRGKPFKTPEAMTLKYVQQAINAHETLSRHMHIGAWLFSRQPLIRPTPSRQKLEVAQALSKAFEWAHRCTRNEVDGIHCIKVFEKGAQQAERALREELEVKMTQIFEEVGLRPQSNVEVHAMHQLIQELIDEMLQRGHLTFGRLRDAISRNQAKLEDIQSLREWLWGDTLIRLDWALSHALEGIYQKSDFYMRILHRLSSMAFGTQSGRFVSLYLILPLLGAFVILEGIGHIAAPIAHWMHWHELQWLTWTKFILTAAGVFALIHSKPFRDFSIQVLEAVGEILAWFFFRIPRALVMHPLLRRWLQKPKVRAWLRRYVFPMVVALIHFGLLWHYQKTWLMSLSIALAIALGLHIVMRSSWGEWVEDFVVEQLAPTWRALGREWIPSLLRMIANLFGHLMNALQDGIHWVDEKLRVRPKDHFLWLIVKVFLGWIWSLIAYVIRLYVTLLLEPELNPIKHFPVVTVFHKLMLPLTPQMMQGLMVILAPLGPIVGGTLAGITVFLIPSMSGFFTWEFKENYKLYRSTRAETLPYAMIGSHGETMRRLLIPGIHSGTLPKRYERLRRAAQRAHESRGKSIKQSMEALAKFQWENQKLERKLRYFIEREWIHPLVAHPQWKHGLLEISKIDLSPNRVRFHIQAPMLKASPMQWIFEHKSGWIIAAIPEPGFLRALEALDDKVALRLIENTLAALYQRAEVDIVREQIHTELGDNIDILDDTLIVWPQHHFCMEWHYDIQDLHTPKTLWPKVVYLKKDGFHKESKVHWHVPMKPKALDLRRISYHYQWISWGLWEDFWNDDSHSLRLLTQHSILPMGKNEMLL